jgi:acyl transferase domain-containing protein/acyl carrier protein
VSDLSFLLNKAGWLWLWGPEIDWKAFHAGEKRFRIPLPTYPFEGRYYWTEENKEGILSASPDEVAGKNKDISNWFYVPSWKRSDSKAVRSDELDRASDWMVFVREGDFPFKLMQRMAQAGCDIITIEPGPRFTRGNDQSYIINPIEPGDYETLINALSKTGRLPGKILHLWNVNEEKDDADKTGFFSLLYLAQALGRCEQYFDQKFQITALADRLVDVTGGEQVCPEKAMLLGPIKVIPQEYPGIRCRAVDIILPETGTWQEKKLIDRLFAELVSEVREPVAAYRGNNRLVQTVEHVQLETHGEKLKREGVYLITGGLGNIGLTAAEFLAKNWQAKLILTGRSPFPTREEWETWLDTNGPGDEISGRILKVKQIEALGSEVIVARADVTHLEEMEAVLIEAEKRFGKLNGVLHAAGIAGEESIKSIKEIDKEKCERIFNARVSGLSVLERMLKGRGPDFCLLFSSLSSVLGGVGLIAYSAANIFMDAFARRQNHRTPFQWISIDWDLWEFEEQKKKIDASSGPGMDLLTMAVKTGEGLEALRRILCHDDGCQFIVSTRELSTRIKKWLELESTFDPGSALPDTAAIQGTSLEQMLTGIWEDYFGVKGIGIHDNFFDLGASSLDLIRLNDRLKKIFKKELAIEKLFTYPTIHSLGKFLGGMESGKTGDEGDGHNAYDEEMERTEAVVKGKNRLKRRKMSSMEKLDD